MEKEYELSWNYVPLVKEVVVDEIFSLPKGYGDQYAHTFDTKGKNFDRYDFVMFEATYSGFTPDITKFDSIAVTLAKASYENWGSNELEYSFDPYGDVSGLVANMYVKDFLDNPPNGWDAEKEGKNKAELLRVNAEWSGHYTYTIESSSPQPANHSFNANILWNNGKITVHTFNRDKDDEITVHLKITGYVGYIHS